jgi:hypothetical protein
VDRAENAVVQGDPRVREFLSDDSQAAASEPMAGRKLRGLRGLLEPRAPLKLGEAKENELYLSDVAWTEAKVGWGGVTRNTFWFDKANPNGAFLTVGGKFRDKGIYAHSPARHVFDLDGKWKTFTVVAGLQNGAGEQGSAVFTILGDGKELRRSRVLRDGQGEKFIVDVAGVKHLELVTEGGEQHNHRSWAVWADPKISR